MPYVDFKDFPAGKVAKPFERELKVILSPDINNDVEGFTFLVSTLSPNGGCTDIHMHEDSGELMIFMSGTGKAWLKGVEHEIKPGVAIYAPPCVPHKTLNTGDEPLMIACVFVPPVSTEYIRQNIEAAQNKNVK